MILPLHKGMSLVSLLITLTIFSGLFFVIHQWSATQRKSAVKTYQHYQGVQIAENQLQRQWIGLPCQHTIRQNAIKFEVSCEQTKVTVRFPVGEVVLERRE
ncbi:DUF5374 domain-containing protein [Conservatibacter flavescens]|uniref:DUF5374 domain-containing protein n=1 Tax=Conservatibacter flavescens TaxID=28161 RepID=A0A2M8S0D9_9PAST|nr:DUF5374 domain-containing protein [Conservatibacter flavescens]PJG84607.1 hypothetical protein CVP05_10035 [Conservatibacter flavescens]